MMVYLEAMQYKVCWKALRHLLWKQKQRGSDIDHIAFEDSTGPMTKYLGRGNFLLNNNLDTGLYLESTYRTPGPGMCFGLWIYQFNRRMTFLMMRHEMSCLVKLWSLHSCRNWWSWALRNYTLGLWFIWKALLWLGFLPFSLPHRTAFFPERDLLKCLPGSHHSKQIMKCFCQELPSTPDPPVLAGTLSSPLQDVCPAFLSPSNDTKLSPA